MEKIMSVDSSLPRREILVLGTLSGRVDQGLGLLHEMIREETQNLGVRIWLFSETNVSFIMRKGRNTVLTGLSGEYFTRNVGIIPIFGPAVITTSGLEWDVKSWATQMGHQISTSNHIVEENIYVETDAHVLFTIERASELPTKTEIREAITNGRAI